MSLGNLYTNYKNGRRPPGDVLSIGPSAGSSSDTGTNWIAIGLQALGLNVAGSNNLAIGHGAGKINLGSNNLFLGNDAGGLELGSNALYIDNTNTTTPLIGGSFTTGVVSFRVGIRVSLPYTVATLPAVAGFTASTMIFVSNGRKPGEATTLGTGVWCSPVGVNWCLLNTTTAVVS
jgi:hypothetical protein